VICEGTYLQSSPGTYKLTHLGWNFDFSGNLIGYFVETQINSVSSDGNSYSGTFEFKFYLMDGTPDPGNPSFSGTLEAARISADQGQAVQMIDLRWISVRGSSKWCSGTGLFRQLDSGDEAVAAAGTVST